MTESETTLPQHPVSGRAFDASLHLLDRSVEDVDGVPATFVTDAELKIEDDQIVIAELVLGSGLLERFFGGHTPSSRLYRIAWAHVADVGTRVVLGVSAADHDVTWPERWVRDHLIGPIPEGRHGPD